MDKCFWAEADMKAVYVKNRLPSPKIAHKTPFEIVHNTQWRQYDEGSSYDRVAFAVSLEVEF